MVFTRVGAVGRGDGAAACDCFGVAAREPGGVLALMCRASMLKCAVGACGLVLVASGRGMSISLAIGRLGIVVSSRHFFYLESL